MAFDYAPAVALANRMIAKFGRAVTFTKVASDIDPTKPLHGPQSTSISVSGVMAAFVEPSSVARLGIRTETNPGMWKDTTQIALVAADGTNDFTTFTGITDSDGSTWKIEHADLFKPGPTAVLYFIGVKR